MFVSFDPLTLLAIIFVCFFIPGAVLAFSIFRKNGFSFIEKSFIGFALAIVCIPAIPFLLYFFLGIKYTYGLALASVGLFYLIAIAAFILTKKYQDLISFFKENKFAGLLQDRKKLIVPVLLLVLLFVSFWIRFGSYSPIFQELDPYFYTYIPQQLLVMGENPVDDETAWYPEVEVDHRVAPELGYLEAIWYSLYNGSNDYDNMILADIASIYPPIAAMLAVFFMYLLIASIYNREYGIIGAGIASFAPMFIFKLMAGEQEVQPYAFFALAFFYAMYALMLLKRENKYAVISGIAFFAVALGSSSEVLATGTLIIFSIIYGLVLYLKEEDKTKLVEMVKLNAIVFVIGVLLGSAILKGFFYNGTLNVQSLIPAAIILVFYGVLAVIKEKLAQYSPKIVVTVLIVAGLLFILSPLGDPLKGIGKSGFGVAQFTSSLYRTIAEQGTAGSFLYGNMGFVAAPYDKMGVEIVTPVMAVLQAILTPVTGADAAETFVSPLNGLGELIGTAFGFLFGIITVIVNLFFSVGVAITNAVLGTAVDYSDKGNTLLFLWIFLFALAFIYSIYRNRDYKIAIPLFFVAFFLPPFLVGILKAKYTIYAAFFLGAGIAFILGETDDFIRKFKGAGKENKILQFELEDEKRKKYAGYVMAFGFVLLFFQFVHSSYAPSLLVNTFNVRFQDDPLAAQEKLQHICDETGDSKVCAAAADPMGYASLGTNYQYDTKLCMLSILSNYTYYSNPPSYAQSELWATQMRCHRIADYWIESMEWIRYNTEEDSRTISWWDYGHWINYFGQKNAVLRNEHASHKMIGATAYNYLHGTPEELIDYMKAHDSEYALFDIELIMMGGNQLGGKYGALNYLSCSYMNRTTVEYSPGQSVCETEHLWDIIYIPKDPTGRTCTISENQGRTGVIGYRVNIGPAGGAAYTLYYPDICRGAITDPNNLYYCQNYVQLEEAYCVGEITLADGSAGTGTYYLNETYPSGDLKLNKAILSMPFEMSGTYHLGDTMAFTLFYTNDKIWVENGDIVSGYEDAKGEFYESNLYRAIFVGEIPGFTKVFDNGGVKIYKIEE